jgi:hypothetical protein
MPAEETPETPCVWRDLSELQQRAWLVAYLHQNAHKRSGQ